MCGAREQDVGEQRLTGRAPSTVACGGCTVEGLQHNGDMSSRPLTFRFIAVDQFVSTLLRTIFVFL